MPKIDPPKDAQSLIIGLILIIVLAGIFVTLLALSVYQLTEARAWFYDTSFGYSLYHEILNIGYDSKEERILIYCLAPFYVFLCGFVLSAIIRLASGKK
tara:strand:- start:133 stop:429 length:297 start_codon:yes stop_codon:yes gene_type:complete